MGVDLLLLLLLCSEDCHLSADIMLSQAWTVQQCVFHVSRIQVQVIAVTG